MKTETFIACLEAIGKKVILTESCIWCSVQKGFYECFPIHKPVYPSWGEIMRVLFMGPALGLRFQTDNSNYKGEESFIYTCEKGSYDLEKLSANNRSKVRRGLKHCRIGRIEDLNYFRTHGWRLNLETLDRQHRSIKSITSAEESWNRLAQAIETFPGLELWGAWVEEVLASYVVSIQLEDCVNLIISRSAKDYLRFYPNNALIYSIVTEMLSREDVAVVSFGREPLEYLEGLDSFKKGMGFQKRPIYQKIVLNPLIGWTSNRLTRWSIHTLAQYRPESTFLKKAARVINLI